MADPIDQAPAPDIQDSPAEYRESLPKIDARPEIDRVIRDLVPSGRSAEIVALFDGQTRYETILGWRRGHRSVPQWARDLLANKLARYRDLEERVRAIPSGPGCRAGLQNLMAWHARNKDKKEKAPD